MAEFSSPSDLVVFLEKIEFRNSPGQKIVKVVLSDPRITDRKQSYEIRVEILGFRREMLVDISNLLRGYEHKLDFENRSYRSSAGVISVRTGVNKKGMPITTYVVVKLHDKAYVLQNQVFNKLLTSLGTKFEKIKYTPDSIYELNVIKEFNESVNKYGKGDPVDVQIQGMYFKNIIGMLSAPPGVKADIILIDRNGDYSCFISHKNGSRATDFQQYSGISSRSGLFDNKNVRRFRNDVVTLGDKTSSEPVYRRIYGDQRLKQQAVFGKDYDSSKRTRSLNNVDFFAQGDIVVSMVREGNPNIIKINFSSRLIHKQDFYKLNGSYDPVLGARVGEQGRNIRGDDDTVIYGVRGGIFPLDYIKTRRNSKEI